MSKLIFPNWFFRNQVQIKRGQVYLKYSLRPRETNTRVDLNRPKKIPADLKRQGKEPSRHGHIQATLKKTFADPGRLPKPEFTKVDLRRSKHWNCFSFSSEKMTLLITLFLDLVLINIYIYKNMFSGIEHFKLKYYLLPFCEYPKVGH